MKKIAVIILIIFISLFGKISPDVFSSYKINNISQGIYIVEVNNFDDSFLPYVVKKRVKTSYNLHKKLKSRLVINAGFFNFQDEPTSFVVINENLVTNMLKNKFSYKNQFPYNVLNRSEFRVLENKSGEIIYDICPHYEKPKSGYKIKHSLQSGPFLYPEFLCNKEGFFRLNTNSVIISAMPHIYEKYARMAVGIKNNRIYFIIIDKNNTMQISKLINLAYRFQFDKVLNLDGGYSTVFDSKTLHIDCSPLFRTRKLKTIFILK